MIEHTSRCKINSASNAVISETVVNTVAARAKFDQLKHCFTYFCKLSFHYLLPVLPSVYGIFHV